MVCACESRFSKSHCLKKHQGVEALLQLWVASDISMFDDGCVRWWWKLRKESVQEVDELYSHYCGIRCKKWQKPRWRQDAKEGESYWYWVMGMGKEFSVHVIVLIKRECWFLEVLFFGLSLYLKCRMTADNLKICWLILALQPKCFIFSCLFMYKNTRGLGRNWKKTPVKLKIPLPFIQFSV